MTDSTYRFKLPYKKKKSTIGKRHLANISLANMKDYRILALVLIAAGIVLAIIGGTNYFKSEGNVKGSFERTISADVTFPTPDHMSTYFVGRNSPDNPGTWNNPWYLYSVDWTGSLIFFGINNVYFYGCRFLYNNFQLHGFCMNFTFVNCTFNSPIGTNFYLSTSADFYNITFINTTFYQLFGIGYGETPPQNIITIQGCEFKSSVLTQGSATDITIIKDSKFLSDARFYSHVSTFQNNTGFGGSTNVLYFYYGNMVASKLTFNNARFDGNNTCIKDSTLDTLQINSLKSISDNITLKNVRLTGYVTTIAVINHLTLDGVRAPYWRQLTTSMLPFYDNCIINNTRFDSYSQFPGTVSFKHAILKNTTLYHDNSDTFALITFNFTLSTIQNCSLTGNENLYAYNTTFRDSQFDKTISTDFMSFVFMECNYTTFDNVVFNFNPSCHLYLQKIKNISFKNSIIPRMAYYSTGSNSISGLVIDNCTSISRTKDGGSDFIATGTPRFENVLVKNSRSSYWYVKTTQSKNNLTFINNDIDAIWICDQSISTTYSNSITIKNNIVHFKSDLINSSHDMLTFSNYENAIGIQVNGASTLIENNTIFNACSGIYLGIRSSTGSSKGIIRNNTICHSYKSYYSIRLQEDGVGSILSNNSVFNFIKTPWDNMGDSFRTLNMLASSSFFTGNIVSNSTQGAFFLQGDNNTIVDNLFYNSSKLCNTASLGAYCNSLVYGDGNTYLRNSFIRCSLTNTASTGTAILLLLMEFTGTKGPEILRNNTFINNKVTVGPGGHLYFIYANTPYVAHFIYTNNTHYNQNVLSFVLTGTNQQLMYNYWCGKPGGASSNGIWYDTPFQVSTSPNFYDSRPLVNINLHNVSLSFISPGLELLTSSANPLNVTIRYTVDRVVEKLLRGMAFTPIISCKIKNANSSQTLTTFFLTRSRQVPSEPGKAWQDAWSWTGLANTTITPGNYTITISTIDLMGFNITTSRTIFVSNSQPMLSMNSPSPQELFNTDAVLIDFTGQAGSGNGFKDGWISISNSTWTSVANKFVIWSVQPQFVSYSSTLNFSTLFGTSKFTHGIFILNITLIDKYSLSISALIELGVEKTTYDPSITLLSPGPVPVPTDTMHAFNFTVTTSDSMPFSSYSMQIYLYPLSFPGTVYGPFPLLYNTTSHVWNYMMPIPSEMDGTYNISVKYDYSYGGTQVERTMQVNRRVVNFNPPYFWFFISNGTIFGTRENLRVSGGVADGNNITYFCMDVWNATWTWHHDIVDPDPMHVWWKTIDYISFPVAMTDGNYTLRFQADDGIGSIGLITYLISLDVNSPSFLDVRSNCTGNIWASNATSIEFLAKIVDSNGVGSVSGDILDGYGTILSSGLTFIPVNSTTYRLILSPQNTTLLADGSYSLRITAIDIYGKESSQFTSFQVNWQDPVIHVVYPINNLLYFSRVLGVQITDGNGINNAWVFVQNKTWISSRTDFSYSNNVWICELPVIPMDGYYAILIYASDLAGRQSLLNVTMGIEQNVPAIFFITPVVGVYNCSSIVVTVNTTSPLGVDKVWLKYNELTGLYTNETATFMKYIGSDIYEATIYFPSIDGDYYLECDANSTMGTTWGSFTYFTMDYFVPEINLVSPANGSVWGDQIYIDVNAYDGNTLQSFALTISNSTRSQTLKGTIYSRSVSVQGYILFDQVSDGVYVLDLWMNTTTGPSANKSIVLFLDRLPPTMTLLSPASNIVLDMVSLNVTAKILDDCGMTDARFTITNSTWSSQVMHLIQGVNHVYSLIYDTRDIPDGNYSLVVEAEDMLISSTTTITIAIQLKNRHVPVVTIVSPGIYVLNMAMMNFTAYIDDAINDVSGAWLVIHNQTWTSTQIAMTKVGSRQFSTFVNASVFQNSLYYFVISTRDAHGYASNGVAFFTLRNDAPQISIISPGNYQQITDEMNVTALVIDGMGVYKTRGSLMNDTWECHFALVLSGTAYASIINTTRMGDGEYTLVIEAINIVSKLTQESLVIFVKNSRMLVYAIAPANGTKININNTKIQVQVNVLNDVMITIANCEVKWANGSLISSNSQSVYGINFKFTCDFSRIHVNVTGTVYIYIQFSDEFSRSYETQLVVHVNMTRIIPSGNKTPLNNPNALGFAAMFYGGIGIVAIGAMIGVVFVIKKRPSKITRS